MDSATFIIMDAAGGKFRAVNYNAKKVIAGNAKLIYFENFGALQHKEHVSKEEFEVYLQKYSSRNKHIKKPVFHGVCSAKGKNLSHEALKDIALKIMDHLGYSDNPMLIFAHSDTENNHVHVVTSRVGLNGKKIKDSYEKKRANHYLNTLLGRNTTEEFNLHLHTALAYKITTAAQFSLLMEREGYSVKKDGEFFVFYKYGKKQGSIQIRKLSDKILSDNNHAFHIRQLRALIYKYKRNCNSRLNSNQTVSYSTSPLKFHSELTDFLKENFGLEFCFFVGKDKENPYGYSLIDHQHKEVYKGSDVMKMDYLIKEEDLANKSSIKKTEGFESLIEIPSMEELHTVSVADLPINLNLFDLRPISEGTTHKNKHLDEEEEFYLKRRRKR
ncbi:MAG TPA: relaxase/mobilization nuclease domain-containing protein [Arachidicoccus soli]|nr:relaxase/mobilization nuclease domain-containing protein [Arachidicoccus soli]